MSDRPFEGILGNTVELRLFEYLLSLPKRDFNITELTKVSGVSRTSVDRTIKEFLAWGITKEVSHRGNMTFYALNEDSQIVKALSALNHSLLEKMCPGLFDGPGEAFALPPNQVTSKGSNVSRGRSATSRSFVVSKMSLGSSHR
jgi:DNA-binding transcriptional ArsR family regulator